MNFSQILMAMPNLSNAELEAVNAYASKLLGSRRSSSRRKGREKTSVGPKNPLLQVVPGKKVKGPAQKVSEHAGNPSYDTMKKAEHSMNVLLREQKKKLADFKGLPEDQVPKEIGEFLRARQCWFREKEILSTKLPQTESGKAQAGAASSLGSSE